jgi:hypothetical protein
MKERGEGIFLSKYMKRWCSPSSSFFDRFVYVAFVYTSTRKKCATHNSLSFSRAKGFFFARHYFAQKGLKTRAFRLKRKTFENVCFCKHQYRGCSTRESRRASQNAYRLSSGLILSLAPLSGDLSNFHMRQGCPDISV